MKKLLSAGAAILLTCALAASAGAADYSNNPNYPLPGNGSNTSSSKPDPTKKIERLPEQGTSLKNPAVLITKESVTKAIENDEPIYASYETAEVKSNAMAALARTNLGRLTVITKRYTVTIDSDTVTEAKDISLAMKVTKNSKRGAMIIRTEQKGSFGCTLNVTFEAKYYSQCGVDLNTAHVYRIDPETKEVEDMGKVQLDSQGRIEISMTSGGKYIVM